MILDEVSAKTRLADAAASSSCIGDFYGACMDEDARRRGSASQPIAAAPAPRSTRSRTSPACSG